MTKYRTILIFGPPGSGKGTQGKTLGTLPGFFHCACGDVFRAIDIRTSVGAAFLEYSSKGQLVPNELTINLWQAHIVNACNSGKYNSEKDYLVLDGIPRNKAQAQIMDPFLDVRMVFNFYCSSRRTLIERIRRRAIKENRPDDASEVVINRRLDVYETESQSLTRHYPSHNVFNINAMPLPHLVLEGILGLVAAGEADADLRIGGQSARLYLEEVRK